MKLPFDFGVKLILRLLIPGFLLTVALYPVIAAVREAAHWGVSMEYLFILCSIVAGWVILSLDQPIYMLFEGRRFWPMPLRKLLTSMEKRRLRRLLWAEEDGYRESEGGSDPGAGEKRNAEAWVKLRKFPLDAQGKPTVLQPTRLGNLIFAYETYPKTRYGVDAIFYWYRIWLMIDNDLREEMDSRQAMADSGLYAAAALAAGGVLWLIYALVGQAIGLPALRNINIFAEVVHDLLGKHLPGIATIVFVALMFFVVAAIVYRVSLFPQAQYGETFKALFDLYESRIDVSRIVSHVARVTKHPQTITQDRRENLMVAWRYLHNHRIKCPHPGCEKRDTIVPEEVQSHLQQMHGVPPGLSPTTAPAPVPVPANFFTDSASVTDKVRTIAKGKRVLWVGSAGALAFGLILHPAIALAASAGSLVGLIAEQRRWNALTQQITSVRRAEAKHGMMHLFEAVNSSRWKKPTVLLPYLFLFAAGLVVFFVGL